MKQNRCKLFILSRRKINCYYSPLLAVVTFNFQASVRWEMLVVRVKWSQNKKRDRQTTYLPQAEYKTSSEGWLLCVLFLIVVVLNFGCLIVVCCLFAQQQQSTSGGEMLIRANKQTTRALTSPTHHSLLLDGHLDSMLCLHLILDVFEGIDGSGGV
jgi:hypothetical protein